MPPIVFWNMIVSVICQDEILQQHLVPLINVTGGGFQHDNTTTHCTSLSRFYIAKRSCLTTVNTIGRFILNRNPCVILDRRVRQMNPPPQSLQEVFMALQNEWQHTLQCAIQKLVASTCRRCAAVIAARGGHNQY